VVEVIGLRSLTKMYIERSPGGMMSEAANSNPSPFYFISYSRQEVTFVDSFSRELEKRGIRNWVDFRNLIPGHPWQPQLDEAVQNANAILLVVSKASMSSGPVKDEWTKSLAAGRRIILILFEPCKLDPGLAGLEWVDFTKRFDRAMDQIITLLESPSQTATAAMPKKKMHLPRAAIAPMGLSLLLAILLILPIIISLFLLIVLKAGHRPSNVPDPTPFDSFLLSVMLAAAFSLWLPSFANFLWLPVQIARRRHNAQTTGYVLYALLSVSLFLLIVPFLASLAADLLKKEYPSTSVLLSDGYFWLTAITVITVVLMIRLLRSEGMYRWSGPRGAVIRTGHPDLTGHTDNGIPMRILVESAPEDQLYAWELKDSIKRAGHICTDDIQNTDIVLPLLSKYKTNSAYDPETIPLIPTLLQSCDVDRHLSRLQWADLRYGKVSMDALANLLDEPKELLRLIGVLPVRTLILPGTINLLSNLMSILLFFLFFQVILSIPASPDDLPGFLLWVILLAVYYFFRKYLTERKLKYRPILSYWWAVGLTALSALAGSLALQSIQPMSLLLWLIPLLMLRRDVRIWLPTRTKRDIFGTEPQMELPAASR
jgi:TIR domain-containing protein